MTVSIKVSPSLQKLFDSGKLVTDNARLTFRNGIRDIALHARKNMKYKNALVQQSIDQRLISDNPLKGEIYINDSVSKLGIYHHEGTGIYGPSKKPIVIVPVKKKVLRFANTKLSGFLSKGKEFWIFAKKVKIKGIKPDLFIKKAIDIKLPKVMEKVEKTILKDYGM